MVRLIREQAYLQIGGGAIKIISKIVLLFCVFVILIYILTNYSLESMDEIWCFGFSNRFANGYIPYQDFNIIVTPLFVVLGSLFSHSLLMFRIFGAFISTGILFLTYSICRRNIADKFIVFTYVAVNGILLLLLIPYANYNLLMLLGLMGSYIIASMYFSNPVSTSAFSLGLCLAITLLIKQNVPTLLFVVFLFIVAFQWILKKIPIKTFGLFVLGWALPIGLFIATTIFAGSFDTFLDYSILGLHSFSSLGNVQSESNFIILLSLILTCLITIRFIQSKENRTRFIGSFVFSICSYLLIIPLVDLYHSLILLILQITLSSSLLVDVNVQFKSKVTKISIIIMLFFIMGLVVFSSIAASREGYILSKIDPYRDVYITEDLEKNISIISEYIVRNEKMGLDVAIIDGSAYLYNLAAGDYNGILDLLNTGNIGTLTNEEIISKINEKSIILASKNYQWQDMQVFKDYVKSNYIEAGTIGDKIIYLKP